MDEKLRPNTLVGKPMNRDSSSPVYPLAKDRVPKESESIAHLSRLGGREK
jgi:hypothetical protein